MLRIEVVYALRHRQTLLAFEVAEGTTVKEALQRSGILQCYPEIDLASGDLGVFGKVVPPATVLRDGDRVEIYRPLIANSRQARRVRAQRTVRWPRRG